MVASDEESELDEASKDLDGWDATVVVQWVIGEMRQSVINSAQDWSQTNCPETWR